MVGNYLSIFLAFFSIVATLVPFSRHGGWYVRGFDFPKPHVVVVCITAIVLWVGQQPAAGAIYWSVIAALVTATAYNIFLVIQFTSIWRKQVADAAVTDSAHSIKLLMSNVQMENTDHASVEALIREEDADVVLLCETDAKWVEAMRGVSTLYPHVIEQPQENFYGMMFLTRLPVEDINVRFLIDAETPSIRAVLRTNGGWRFVFIGLHPAPPLPGRGSELRDAELMVVAKETKDMSDPVIVAGDLNDVAWSHTTRKFKRISRMLDPRVGRGYLASFHADYWFARWPLDHLFHSNDFELEHLSLRPSVGSDHFPVSSTLQLVHGETRNDPQDIEKPSDMPEADEAIRLGIAEAGL